MRTMVAACVLLASCLHYEEFRLPTFDAAHALPMTPLEPAFFTAAQVPSDMPLATPYAQVVGDFPPSWDEFQRSWYLVEQCFNRGFRPDFIVFVSRGVASSGNALQVSPTFSTGGIYGFSFSPTPAVRGAAAVTCYRLAPVSLGIRTDANWMVTHVDEAARSSGLQEGDSLQSINGHDMRPRTPQDVSPWAAAALTKKPRDEVWVEWIRPGTGRMRGKLALGEPEAMPADAKPATTPPYCYRLNWR